MSLRPPPHQAVLRFRTFCSYERKYKSMHILYLKGQCQYFDQGVQRQPRPSQGTSRELKLNMRKWGRVIEKKVKISGYYM